MSATNSRFQQQVSHRASRSKSALCVGLDPVPERMPEGISQDAEGVRRFCAAIVEATSQYAACYKPNSAFFEALGEAGYSILRETIAACHRREVPVILDAKRGDIGSTAQLYARAAFERLDADAITINAYLGLDGVKPFRDFEDRTSFVLCYTSNPSRTDLQTRLDSEGKPLYMHMADCIRGWNESGNLGAVVGATAPEELADVRRVLGPDAPILCPGVGAQGGDLEASLVAGTGGRPGDCPGNLLINASRGVIYASNGDDFAEAAETAARELCEAMAMVWATGD